jgi:hypothetical protein
MTGSSGHNHKLNGLGRPSTAYRRLDFLKVTTAERIRQINAPSRGKRPSKGSRGEPDRGGARDAEHGAIQRVAAREGMSVVAGRLASFGRGLHKDFLLDMGGAPPSKCRADGRRLPTSHLAREPSPRILFPKRSDFRYDYPSLAFPIEAPRRVATLPCAEREESYSSKDVVLQLEVA